MGQAENIRRHQLLEKMKRLTDYHCKTWRIEETPGVIRFVYDPAAAAAAGVAASSEAPAAAD